MKYTREFTIAKLEYKNQENANLIEVTAFDNDNVLSWTVPFDDVAEFMNLGQVIEVTYDSGK